MNEAFIDYLINQKIILQDHLAILKQEEEATSENLIQIALRMRFIDKEDLIKNYSHYLKIPYFDVSKDIQNLRSIGNLHIGYICYETETSIGIIVEDPKNIIVTDQIKRLLPLQKKIEWFCGNLEKLKLHKEKTSDIVESIIVDAIKAGASDIHFFSKEYTMDVYLRLYGHMKLYKIYHKSASSTLINRLKILAKLDIANTKTSQSGMFIYKENQYPIHCRVSFHPSYFGEKVNIRLLNPYQQSFHLESLGFKEDDLNIIRKTLNNRSGLIILTGETGSGKTTTLYACLNELEKRQLNIMTLEDPVECFLPFATQTQVSSQFNYAQGIRSLLRQDPDVILIGEIRDEEAATMAFRAAMTGHLVLTTLHTQNIHTIKDRLRNLGIDEHLIDSFTLLTVSQSLEPVFHNDCNAKGCKECNDHGILKRSLQYELSRPHF